MNGFNQLYKGGEVAIQSVVAHNIHKNIGKVQEGWTSLMAIGPLTKYIEHDQPGKDETGLGWWAVMTFKGDRGKTRVICGYNPLLQQVSRKQHYPPTAPQVPDHPEEGLYVPPDEVQGRLGLPITAVV